MLLAFSDDFRLAFLNGLWKCFGWLGGNVGRIRGSVFGESLGLLGAFWGRLRGLLGAFWRLLAGFVRVLEVKLA